MNGFPYEDDWRWTGEVITVAQLELDDTLNLDFMPTRLSRWFCLREDGYTFIPGWEDLYDACAEAAWLMGFDPVHNSGYAGRTEPVKGP